MQALSGLGPLPLHLLRAPSLERAELRLQLTHRSELLIAHLGGRPLHSHLNLPSLRPIPAKARALLRRPIPTRPDQPAIARAVRLLERQSVAMSARACAAPWQASGRSGGVLTAYHFRSAHTEESRMGCTLHGVCCALHGRVLRVARCVLPAQARPSRAAPFPGFARAPPRCTWTARPVPPCLSCTHRVHAVPTSPTHRIVQRAESGRPAGGPSEAARITGPGPLETAGAGAPLREAPL